jgi:hypothetical protein
VAMALSLKRYFSTVGLEILLAETVSNMDFWVLTPRNSEKPDVSDESSRLLLVGCLYGLLFGPEDGHDMFLRNLGLTLRLWRRTWHVPPKFRAHSSALRADMACFSEASGLLFGPEDGHDMFLRNFGLILRLWGRTWHVSPKLRAYSSAPKTVITCSSEISGLLLDPEDGYDVFLRNFGLTLRPWRRTWHVPQKLRACSSVLKTNITHFSETSEEPGMPY